VSQLAGASILVESLVVQSIEGKMVSGDGGKGESDGRIGVN
jgi:hypothetical protein